MEEKSVRSVKMSDKLYVQLTRPCHAGFTGVLGPYSYTNGVIDKPITIAQALRIAGSFGIADLAGKPISPVWRSKPGYLLADEEGGVPGSVAEAAAAEEVAVEEEVVEEPAAPVVPAWTTEELEQIADKHGIEGLREIAEDKGIKGRSISDLVKRLKGEPK